MTTTASQLLVTNAARGVFADLSASEVLPEDFSLTEAQIDTLAAIAEQLTATRPDAVAVTFIDAFVRQATKPDTTLSPVTAGIHAAIASEADRRATIANMGPDTHMELLQVAKAVYFAANPLPEVTR